MKADILRKLEMPFNNNPAEKAARAHLAAIVDSSDDAIISKNLDGVITSWNASAEHLFGYTAAEAIGQHISLLIPTERLDEEYVIIGKVKAGQRVDHFETMRRNKAGELIEISLTVSPIRDDDGNIIGASKIARNVMQQRRTERALQEVSLRRDEFLATVSHELRTPMNAVIGLAHILSKSTTMTPKEKEYVHTLKQSADSMMSLINGLLDVSKFESGDMELEEIEFSLPELVETTLKIAGAGAREKKLELKTSYSAGVRKYYMGDPQRIRQIVSNLVANAVKFTDAGRVAVGVSAEPGDRQSMVSIEISDTGIGIPEDKLEAVFDKFVQADSSNTRKYGGTGLGLSIAKAFVEQMGGTITVKSRVNFGTTFLIRLPLRNSVQAGIIDSAEHADAQYKNILVVDDYQANIIVTGAMLEELGYSYDTASTGLEALRQFQTARYDAILMDIQMHEMDGFETTRNIRQYETDHRLKPTPIIAMTAHVMEKDRQQCTAAGMNDFIPKPFDPDMLADVLAQFVSKQAKVA